MNYWQSYVDLNLMKAGLKQAAIAGHDGQVWANSDGFGLTQAEVLTLMSSFEHPLAALRYGCTLGGKKYFTLAVDNQGLLGRSCSDGCICVKTCEELLVCVYDGRLPCHKALKIVETFASYLRVLSF
jgi:profilin